MASHCMKLSTGLLHLTVWCLLGPDDITTTGTFMVFCDRGPCGLGELFDPTTSACSPCDQGSFMDRQNHQCHQCIPCLEPNRLEHELVLRNCTATSDTEIGCDGLHYKVMLDDLAEPYCERCTECGEGQRVEQTCGSDSDTVCVSDGVDTTHDKGGSFHVSGSSPQLVEANRSTSDVNTRRIYNDDAFHNKSAPILLSVVLGVIFVGIVVCIIIMLIYAQRLRSIRKMSQKSSYSRMQEMPEGHI